MMARAAAALACLALSAASVSASEACAEGSGRACERVQAESLEEALQWEEHSGESTNVQLIQKKSRTKSAADSSSVDQLTYDAAESSPQGQEKTLDAADVEGLVTLDHNGHLCMLCSKPLPERVDKEYKEFRTDCGRSSSPTGPAATDLSKPVVQFMEKGNQMKKNGFCELNYAKSCADAIANKDYLYWAKSLNLKDPRMRSTAIWDARYCYKNGFLDKDVVALQHDFYGMQAKSRELCKLKYAKHGIEKLSFLDMMTLSKYNDASAPSLQDAEALAAWNCGMGDIGCDMAMCAYSYCVKGNNSIGLYDECEGWDPIKGMPVSQ
mmetsp:Transcript_49308/g.86831  ORF Transcript_49308/g.86831 Transcript_49308/m.86831 type:complete len:324 (+) Transcript_49308:57-1028(+)